MIYGDFFMIFSPKRPQPFYMLCAMLALFASATSFSGTVAMLAL